MADSWIDGKPATLDAATAEAARRLAASRLPVIAGLGTDMAGARAAIRLAERIGGVLDHMNSGPLQRDLDVVREAGLMATTPNEARLRADVLLLVGPGLTSAWPELPARLLTAHVPSDSGTERRIFWLCPGRRDAALPSGDGRVAVIGRDPRDLPVGLAALRARVAGRPFGDTRLPGRALDALAAQLRSARFGVAVWSATEMDALAIEMLCGLVKDLNSETRFTGLPLMPGDNAWGVQQACGWMTGYPVRTGFGRGFPEHDPWRFDATRLVESGEAGCALWISAYRPAAPDWRRAVPLIALTGQDADFRRPPRVQIAVGCPGIDHDSVAFMPAAGTLVPVTAAAP